MIRKLTDLQRATLLAAQDTLYGDTKIPDEQLDGRCVRGLRLRGLVEGDMPHVYLTDAGRQTLTNLECEMTAFN